MKYCELTEMNIDCIVGGLKQMQSTCRLYVKKGMLYINPNNSFISHPSISQHANKKDTVGF